MLFMLHNCWLDNWSQWGLWGALDFRRACHIPRICLVPKSTLGSLCVSANHGNVAVGPVDITILWPPRRQSFSATQNPGETVCLGQVRLLNAKYLSKYIYLIDCLIQPPLPFSGNTWWTRCHLSHDISPSFLHSKVICVNVFWGAAICCYRATRTFFAPVCSLWSSPWHSLQQLALFPPPRHKSLTFRKCPRSSGQQDNKPEFASVLYFTGRTDNRLTLWISNLVLYILHTSDLYNNPYRKEAKNRDSSPFIDVLLHLKMAEFIKTNRQKRV